MARGQKKSSSYWREVLKSKHSEIDQRFLILFKLDAMNLFNNISSRSNDYIEAFSLKRNRGVFKEVFENRYSRASIDNLSHCPVEVIEVLNSFYTAVDKLYWYLKTTQDMPNTIEDEVTRKVARIGVLYDQVELFVDAELSGEAIDYDEPVESNNIHDLELKFDGEIQEEDSHEDFIQDQEYPDMFDDSVEKP